VFILSPDGVKIEIYEDNTIAAPIVNHHIHFYDASENDTKAWYVKTFSAKAGKFEAADVPGVNLSFTASEKPVVGTKGRALDHIGFEVKDLESFCKKLEAEGIKFDVPYRFRALASTDCARPPSTIYDFFTSPLRLNGGLSLISNYAPGEAGSGAVISII
jgi:catechol 2,3-dioxygenase-like lactoylglutathione lyase family enzyme